MNLAKFRVLFKYGNEKYRVAGGFQTYSEAQDKLNKLRKLEPECSHAITRVDETILFEILKPKTQLT
jgi:hypothetical protein